MATTITRSTIVEKLSAIKNVARREIERRSINRRATGWSSITAPEVGIDSGTMSLSGAALTQQAGKSRGLAKSVTESLPVEPVKAAPAKPKSGTSKRRSPASRVRNSNPVAQEAFRKAFDHFPEGSKLQRATAVTASGLVNHHGVTDVNTAVAQAVAATEQRVRDGKLPDPMGLVSKS